jgi:glycerophosphoryl diester phosphodiesterase
MAAFRKARETGAPGIELDIHVCASGELVVAHDDHFRRTAPEGGEGRGIEELAYEDIKRIDVGEAFGCQSPAQIASAVPPGAYCGERPPLLEEVLETFCPGMYIDIELKTRKTRGDPLPGLLSEMLKKFGDKVSAAVTVSSFNPVAVGAFKKLCPRIPTAVIFCVDPEVPPLLRRGFGRFIAGCGYLKPIYKQTGPFSRFRWSVLEGRPLVPWTIDDPAIVAKMLDLGCAGVITNRPQDMTGLML